MNQQDRSQHGPQQGCNYNRCGNPGSGESCPFVRAARSALAPGDQAAGCRHEWRQLRYVEPAALHFYCVRCLYVCEKPITA
jgi:hypothetical protein